MTENTSVKTIESEGMSYSMLGNRTKFLLTVLSIVGIGIGVFYMFGFTFRGEVLNTYTYYFLFAACFLSGSFLVLPAGKSKQMHWYDYGASALTFGLSIYFLLNSWEIFLTGWLPASPLNVVLGGIFALTILEACRRSGGTIFLIVCVIFLIYPLFADQLPGQLWGKASSINEAISQVIFGGSGILGLPMKILGEILLGFLIFSGMMVASGAGQTFIDIALGLVGKYRGGPAKVAVISSAFFGSLSGSVVSNVVATGSFTIPAMKRVGYPDYFAGAVEAVASTGGVIMPPVMGAVAFIMAGLLNIPYGDIMIAAAIPAILYYWGLIVQIDAYAGRGGLKGLPRIEIPSLKKTLQNGWPFFFVLAFLVWGMLYMRWDEKAPFYASGLMLVLSFIRKETRITPRKFVDALAQIGSIICQTTAILLPIGFIMYGLTITGATGALSAFLISLAGSNVYLMLLIGAIICFVLGMMGLASAAYIFLAVTLAPAVVQASDLNILAVHLFILYWSMLAAITPPVALGALVGASIAKANPMKTSIQSMRLGVVAYFIPFFFVFSSSLILKGSIIDIFLNVCTAVLGIYFIGAGFEGYLLKIGKLDIWTRIFLPIAGTLIAFPHLYTTLIGLAIAIAIIAILLTIKRRQYRLSGM